MTDKEKIDFLKSTLETLKGLIAIAEIKENIDLVVARSTIEEALEFIEY